MSVHGRWRWHAHHGVPWKLQFFVISDLHEDHRTDDSPGHGQQTLDQHFGSGIIRHFGSTLHGLCSLPGQVTSRRDSLPGETTTVLRRRQRQMAVLQFHLVRSQNQDRSPTRVGSTPGESICTWGNKGQSN